MELSESNPYANGELVQFADGSAELNTPEINYQPHASDKLHTVLEGETLVYIAWQQYEHIVANPHEYWHVLMVANGIENPLDLSDFVGKDLIIPDLLRYKLLYG